MQQGILLHRRIDAFSDTHPLVKEAVHLVKEVGGRYAAVVTDIFFDHFLAVDFRLYATCSLGSFAGVFIWPYYCATRIYLLVFRDFYGIL